MGSKLTDIEIARHVKENPSIGFDQCSVCTGIETQGSMKNSSEDINSYELICDECRIAIKPLPLPRIWTVDVCRTTTAFKSIKVIATTEEEACEIAIDNAGDEEFGSGEADYSAPDGAL